MKMYILLLIESRLTTTSTNFLCKFFETGLLVVMRKQLRFSFHSYQFHRIGVVGCLFTMPQKNKKLNMSIVDDGYSSPKNNAISDISDPEDDETSNNCS